MSNFDISITNEQGSRQMVHIDHTHADFTTNDKVLQNYVNYFKETLQMVQKLETVETNGVYSLFESRQEKTVGYIYNTVKYKKVCVYTFELVPVLETFPCPVSTNDPEPDPEKSHVPD